MNDAPATLICFLLLNVSNVGHIATVWLDCPSLWQKTLRRIFSNDYILLYSIVTRLLFLNLSRLLLGRHRPIELKVCLDDLAGRLSVRSLAVIASRTTRA